MDRPLTSNTKVTEAGDSVVLLEYWNVDVRWEKTRKYMANLRMREAITEFHRDVGPHTYNRGSKPIDGIFMTQVINRPRRIYAFWCGNWK
jgi:hypothetical protein